MVVRQTSTQSLEVTVPNTGESFWIYMTVVFKDKSGAIIDGPLFSKCEVKHLSEYNKCCLFLPNKLCEVGMDCFCISSQLKSCFIRLCFCLIYLLDGISSRDGILSFSSFFTPLKMIELTKACEVGLVVK